MVCLGGWYVAPVGASVIAASVVGASVGITVGVKLLKAIASVGTKVGVGVAEKQHEQLGKNSLKPTRVACCMDGGILCVCVVSRP